MTIRPLIARDADMVVTYDEAEALGRQLRRRLIAAGVIRSPGQPLPPHDSDEGWADAVQALLLTVRDMAVARPAGGGHDG